MRRLKASALFKYRTGEIGHSHMSSKYSTSEGVPVNTELGLERIVFFSDAVMAIAITLLAIEIKIPLVAASAARSELPGLLSDLSPRIMSFVISFAVIGIYWMSHHRYFSLVRRYDNRLMLLNLLFLLFIAFMPFVASLLGQYVYLSLSVVVYSAAVVALGLSLGAIWWYASHNCRLVDEALDRRLIRQMNVRALAAPIVFLISIPFALIKPLWAIIIWWASPPIVVAAVRLLAPTKVKSSNHT
jgi:uncharacterized membrane protein